MFADQIVLKNGDRPAGVRSQEVAELGKGLGEGIRALKEGMKDHSSTPASTQASIEQSKNTETKS